MNILQLSPDHIWKAAPGCRILVLDHGAVRFDFPQHWIVSRRSKYLLLMDGLPPSDRCMLAISWRRMSQGVQSLSLLRLLDELAGEESRRILRRSEVYRLFRPPLEAAWADLRVEIPSGTGTMGSRVGVARADCTVVVVVFDFWPEDELSVNGVWEIFLDTLRIGDYIEDPATGRRRMKRG